MGLLNIFKKGKKPTEETKSKGAALTFNIEYNTMSNGNLQVELSDERTSDVTRLVIKIQPLNIQNHPVYNCAVSWYSSQDCQFLNTQTGKYESPRAEQYRGVLAEIDLDLLQKDPNYCNAVIRGLLDRDRVERYLEMGLQETPELPCGKYVGGIMKTKEGYRKFFNEKVGRASHNSPLMIQRRQRHREEEEDIKRRRIADKKDEIARLQGEIDEMEK